MSTATKCAVCGLTTEPNRQAKVQCIARHGVGVCCHLGEVIITDEGRRIAAVPWPDCVVVPIVECVSHWLPREPSREAVGCKECPPEAMATVLLVERPGLTTHTMHCLNCGDTRVVRTVMGL